MSDLHQLYVLTQIRKRAKISLAEMARACGLTGSRAYDSASAWEQGKSVPRTSTRAAFLSYLAHTLGLAADPATLVAVWDVLVHAWGWEPLQPADWQLVESGRPLVTSLPKYHPRIEAGPPGKRVPIPARDLPDPTPLPPGSLVPFAPNPHFVGRAAELQALAGHLQHGAVTLAQNARAALAGPGGIGKTQLAIEFVHRYGQHFPGGVFWLSFADPEAVPAAIAACGGSDALNLHPAFAQLNLDTQVRLVIEAWHAPAFRLLVFDNCEDPELLQHWLPQRSGCRVLITSRRASWDADLAIATLPVSLLSRTESLALLRNYCPTPQVRDEELIAIAAELDDLPLALHLAGSYLSRGVDTLNPGQYLAELRRALSGDLPAMSEHPSLAGTGPRGRPLPTPTGHLNNLEQTFALSFARLDGGNDEDLTARRLLLRAAWFAPGEPIPVELLRDTVTDQRAQAVFSAALQRLLDTGLLVINAGSGVGTVRLHRLVAAFLRHQDGAREAQHAVETAVLQHVRALNKTLDEPALLKVQVHLRTITDAALQRGDAIAAALSYELSRHLGEIEQYAESTAYNQRSLALRERLFGPEDVRLVENLHFSGELLDWQGDYSGALPAHERGLAICIRTYGPDHLETATSLLHVGEIAHALCDYATARTAYEEALDIRVRHVGADSPAAAELHNNLGLLLNATGDFAAALPHAERAVAIWEALPHPNRSRQALALNNLGYLRRAQGEYALALPLLYRALTIKEEVYGPSNTFAGVTHNHIGRVYAYLGDLVHAHAELERAQKIFLDALGSDHPLTANTLSNLGMLALEQGDAAQAQTHLEHAFAIHARLCGTEHRHTARSLNRLGLLHQALGDAVNARRYFRDALAIRRRILGDLHHDTANTLGHLGMLHLTTGRLQQARPLLVEALRVHQSRLGERHPYTARSLLRMGQVCSALGERESSGDYLNRALAAYTVVLGPDHPYTLAARKALDQSIYSPN
jgi:tetratricopeptide (TPR) repeat protein/transcriptional regulator with XRE-family HTH domain